MSSIIFGFKIGKIINSTFVGIDAILRINIITTNDGEKSYNDKDFIESEKVRLRNLKEGARKHFGDE